MEPAGSEQARLRWQCRRGLKELDLLLERYVMEVWPVAPAAERLQFLRLVECEDPELTALLSGATPPGDPALAALLARVRAGCVSPSC